MTVSTSKRSVTIHFTLREAQLIRVFKKHKDLSTVDSFRGWRDSPEFEALEEYNLIYHCNAHADGAYIRYALTELGEKLTSSL